MEVLGFDINSWLLIFTFFIIGLYLLLTWRFNELKDLGIPHPKPLPLLGNLGDVFVNGIRDIDSRMVKKYGKIYGFYEGRSPTITVADPKILKQILIKDFNKFTDRRPFFFRGDFKYGVFDVNGAHWKTMRNQLTPAFSSGKLKQLLGIMNKCSNVFVKHMETAIDSKEVIETKKVCQAFTMDVIASAAFGIHLDTQANPKSKFNELGRKLTDVPVTSPLVFLLLFCPGVARIIDWLFGDSLTMFDREAANYFNTFIRQAIDEKKNAKNHKDFLGIMVDSERNLNSDEQDKRDTENFNLEDVETKVTGLTTDEIIGNGLLFFTAGFETTATTFAYMLYFIALNMDVQQKLQREIDALLDDKDEATYEQINKMAYLDMVINETLRITTPVSRLDRVAKEDMEYDGLRIPRGTIVNIPFLGMHRDPEAWPEPDKFDPERFSPEQKAKRDPIYFIPFGQGPRNCIGMRLALMELKLVMAQVVSKFTFHKCDKTPIPLTFDNRMLMPFTREGLWIKAEKR